MPPGGRNDEDRGRPLRNLLLGDLLATIFQPARRRAGPAAAPGDMASLCRDLLGTRGEVSGMTMAQAVLDTYRTLDAAGRAVFFEMLASDHEIDAGLCLEAAEALRARRDPATLAAMRAAAEPPRQELLRRLNLAPGGTEALVRMREDLMALLPRAPHLASVDDDFLHLFASWFNRGFLVLRRMDWTSPAALLEKIIAYEAVHAIAGWPELRRRVEPSDRLCYAFFHPAMPGEPLIVIEVALSTVVPDRIGALLARDRPLLPAREATVACFYSISNCQPGLRGVSFGNFLIKQVAGELAALHPSLATFVTLSPMPGFAAWARGEVSGTDPAGLPPRALAALASRYLLEAKRGDGLPLDAVARFHLGNGAMVEAVRPGGDESARALDQSFGMMVNYRYDLGSIEDNHEAFRRTGRVAASASVTALLKDARHDKTTRWPIPSMTH